MSGAQINYPGTGPAARARAEKDRTCYEQNCETARGLNRQLNQLPVLVITLTGGLWYGSTIVEDTQDPARFGILCFAAICNLLLVFAAMRIRDVLEGHLEKIREFHRYWYAGGGPQKPMLPWLKSYSMITIYAVLMIVAGLLSMAGAVGLYWPAGWGEWARVLVWLLSLGTVGGTVFTLWRGIVQ